MAYIEIITIIAFGYWLLAPTFKTTTRNDK